MPIYEYACAQCGKTTDVLQKVDDPAPDRCEHCGAQGSLARQVSRTSFVLKGGGWYSDLYSSKKDAKPTTDSATSSSTSAATPSSPSAPASGSTSTSPSPAPAPKPPSGGGETK